MDKQGMPKTCKRVGNYLKKTNNMKKSKLILSVIVFLAAIAGAFASKTVMNQPSVFARPNGNPLACLPISSCTGLPGLPSPSCTAIVFGNTYYADAECIFPVTARFKTDL
jgi:hypothetical protein